MSDPRARGARLESIALSQGLDWNVVRRLDRRDDDNRRLDLGLDQSQEPRAGALSAPLFLGFALASIGGPIALLSFLPAGTDALTVLLALLVFAAPLAVWLTYSTRIVSAGGLTAFVDATVGRRAALAHGWIWSFAYFLYLPYTITFVVYDVLDPVFPGIDPYRGALELVLPVLIVGVALLPVRAALAALGVLAAMQIVALLVLAGFEYAHAPVTFAVHPSVNDTGRATGAVALLFICASLPLYLGSEVRGGSRTVRRGLVAAVAVVGIALFVTTLPFARRDAVAVAQAYSGRPLAIAVGLLTAGSALALIVAEYLALGRLLHWLHGFSLRTVLACIAVPFVAADAISLVDPNRFYDDLLKPSLGALFVALAAVAVIFPLWRRTPAAVALASVATGLAAWGFYTLVAGSAAS